MSTHKKREITHWYSEHSDAILKYILLMTRDYQQAEDLTHDTFIKAYQNIETFQRNSSAKTWLFRIAHNVTIDFMRKRKPLLFFTTLFFSIDTEPLPEEIVQVKENSKELYKAIGKLKVSYREVIILRNIRDFTIKETAEILEWSESKVKMTLSRAMTALQKELVKGGQGS